MSNDQKPHIVELHNISLLKAATSSKAFTSDDGCEWYVKAYPKGDRSVDDHMSLYLNVANRKSLQTGWMRKARFYFVLLNQSNKELYRSPMDASTLFCAKSPAWGFRKTLPLSKFQEKGFLKNDRLIVKVYINVLEVDDGEDEDVSKSKEVVDINGFQVFASQAALVKKIFAKNPEFAKDFKPNNEVVKTAYMNVLLNLIKTLQKPQKSLSKTKRSKACSDLTDLLDAGFNLDWLKSKLELEERKKEDDADVSHRVVQQLEERVKNLELLGFGNLKLKLDEEVFSERKKANYADVLRVQQLEERIKKFELLESSFNVDSLKSKLEEISLERKKDWSQVQKLEDNFKNLESSCVSRNFLNLICKDVFAERSKAHDAVESQVKQLEESVKNLEMADRDNLNSLMATIENVSEENMESYGYVESQVKQLEKNVKKLEIADCNNLNCLSARIEYVSMERMQSYDYVESQVRQLEKSVNNLELMVSQDKEKTKSSADDFLLVDNVDEL